VCSKAYAITKSALVPTTVVNDEELVEANSKLQLLGVAVGMVGGLPAVGILKLFDAAWVLRMAAVVLIAAGIAGMRIEKAPADKLPGPPEQRSELHTAGIVLAASAMGLLRATVGFLTFLVAFGFRHEHAPSWWFGIVLMASMAGTLVGAAIAPLVRTKIREENILLGSLGMMTVVGIMASWGGDVRVWSAVTAGAMGTAAAAGKLAFDSLVQRDAPDAARGRTFARFETRFQLSWVAGSFLPVVARIPIRPGVSVIASVLGFAAFTYMAGRRTMRQKHSHPPSPHAPEQ
jgi:hypothetical protein